MISRAYLQVGFVVPEVGDYTLAIGVAGVLSDPVDIPVVELKGEEDAEDDDDKLDSDGGPLLPAQIAGYPLEQGGLARLVRGQMLSLQQRDYVIAARAMGASRMRIVVSHMLPNTLGPVIVAVTFGIPIAIFAEAALSFLGFGFQPPTVSLGRHGFWCRG